MLFEKLLWKDFYTDYTVFYPFLSKCDNIKWDKVFRNGPSEICGRQPLKNLSHIPSNLLKAVFHKFYLVHSWIHCNKWHHFIYMCVSQTKSSRTQVEHVSYMKTLRTTVRLLSLEQLLSESTSKMKKFIINLQKKKIKLYFQAWFLFTGV